MMRTKTRILIVDDNDDLRKLLKAVFSVGEYATLEAENGSAALDLAESVFPDIVVLDINMPGIDGLEVCRRIRAIPKLKKCVVILLTGCNHQDDREAGMKAGADSYLVKPFSPSELVSMIENIHAARKSDDQVQRSRNRGWSSSSFWWPVKRFVFMTLAAALFMALMHPLAIHLGWH